MCMSTTSLSNGQPPSLNFTISTIIAYRSSYLLENSSITRSIFLTKNKEQGGTMNLKKIKKKERKEKRQQVIKFSKKKSKLNYGGGRCLIIATAVNG